MRSDIASQDPELQIIRRNFTLVLPEDINHDCRVLLMILVLHGSGNFRNVRYRTLLWRRGGDGHRAGDLQDDVSMYVLTMIVHFGRRGKEG